MSDPQPVLSALDAATADLAAARAALARVEALCDREEREQSDANVRRRVGDVRCRRCDLRYEERQQYSCVEAGMRHCYDDRELGEEGCVADGDADGASVPVPDLRAAIGPCVDCGGAPLSCEAGDGTPCPYDGTVGYGDGMGASSPPALAVQGPSKPATNPGLDTAAVRVTTAHHLHPGYPQTVILQLCDALDAARADVVRQERRRLDECEAHDREVRRAEQAEAETEEQDKRTELWRAKANDLANTPARVEALCTRMESRRSFHDGYATAEELRAALAGPGWPDQAPAGGVNAAYPSVMAGHHDPARTSTAGPSQASAAGGTTEPCA